MGGWAVLMGLEGSMVSGSGQAMSCGWRMRALDVLMVKQQSFIWH